LPVNKIFFKNIRTEKADSKITKYQRDKIVLINGLALRVSGTGKKNNVEKKRRRSLERIVYGYYCFFFALNDSRDICCD
jgi:hypothetical protein